MNGTVADIIEWIGQFRPRHPGQTPARLRMHPSVANDITNRHPGVAASGHAPHGDPGGIRLLGLKVDLAWDLPPGVWRILSADGILLHDSRSGKLQ